MTTVSSRLAREVAERAHYRCEYCRTPQIITAQSFHVDHILPESQGGFTSLENLCYACPHCNLHKGDRVSGLDPRTTREVPLYDPRRHVWGTHFRWSPTFRYIIGSTPTGRATVIMLKLNAQSLVRAREMWVVLKLLP
jgi:hypothetical protein